MDIEIHRFNLISPLYYTPLAQPEPFDYPAPSAGKPAPPTERSADCPPMEVTGAPGEERLFCFELDEREAGSFEPDKNGLLARLVFGGAAAGCEPGWAPGGDPGGTKGAEETQPELPRGKYLFAQKREILSRDDIITMAVEIQQEGLWQRLEPGKTLYLRYLFEDGSFVTQLFRPYLKGQSPAGANGTED